MRVIRAAALGRAGRRIPGRCPSLGTRPAEGEELAVTWTRRHTERAVVAATLSDLIPRQRVVTSAPPPKPVRERDAVAPRRGWNVPYGGRAATGTGSAVYR